MGGIVRGTDLLLIEIYDHAFSIWNVESVFYIRRLCSNPTKKNGGGRGKKEGKVLFFFFPTLSDNVTFFPFLKKTDQTKWPPRKLTHLPSSTTWLLVVLPVRKHRSVHLNVVWLAVMFLWSAVDSSFLSFRFAPTFSPSLFAHALTGRYTPEEEPADATPTDIQTLFECM